MEEYKWARNEYDEEAEREEITKMTNVLLMLHM